MSQRMVEQDALERAKANAEMSPLEKAGAAMQAARLVGSGLTQLVMSMPTRIRSGDQAADDYIAENIYQPTIPKATEYVGDFGEMMEQLETKYKIPPIMPELLPFQEMTGPAMRQISRTAPKAAGATSLGGLQMADQGFAGGGLLKGIKAARKGAPNAERSMPARGALRFADEPAGGPSVIKEKGGNWMGGNVAGNVDKKLNQFKTPTVAGETPAQRIPKHEALLQDPTLNQDQIDRVLYQLEATKGEAAVDQWIANNVGNYIKKDMATPTDPVRLMFEKRAQEIEAQFQTDMNRAQRTRARAEAETDPRRQANLMRQAAQQEEQAKFDRDFATEHITHLPKDEWGELSNPSEELMQKRLREGFQMLGEAKSDPAQRWENLTDEAIDITRAGDIQKQQAMEAQSKQANLAFDKLFNEIDERYSVEFRKALQDRGIPFEDQQFMNLIRSTPITEKANFLGLGDQFKKLRQESFNADKMFSSGLQEIGEENPFVFKVDPETNIYSAYTGDLGIDHVIDVIRQDVRDGRIRPEQLNKLSMDQAIQRTAEFNMEQAKKMRDTAIKQTEGMPTHKEYSDEGYKWIELRQPEAKLEEGHYIIQDKPSASNWKVVPHPDGEGYALRADNGQMALDGRGIAERKWNSPQEAKGSIAEYAEIQEPYPDEMFRIVDQSGNTISVGATEKEALKLYKRQERDQQLAEALKYEGDTMGHCVGGYCPDVLEGRTRIYSLRDKRGEPHVTVEVQPHNPNLEFKYAKQNLPELYEKYNANRNDYFNSWPEFLKKEAPELLNATENKIVQIKGKGNARPVEKYDPYTQDFVRSGNWSDVGDLKNTGLVKYEGKIMTQAEADDMLYQQLNADKPGITDELGLTPPPDGMKHGGSVHISDNPDTMMMELGDQHFAPGGAAVKMAKLARAPAKTKAEIDVIAQRMAPQITGEYVRGKKGAKTVAGKTQKQFEREKTLEHDIRPTAGERPAVTPMDIETLKDNVMLGISGDPTITGQTVYGVAGRELQSPAPQHGGPLYGLGREDDAFWASNLGAASGVQGRVKEASDLYEAPVIGNYVKMGPDSYSYAQHFADTAMQAIDPSKMTKRQIEGFNSMIRNGYIYRDGNGAMRRRVFPAFPGIENPEEMYLHMTIDPELRTHFGDLMQMPTVTEKFNLPSGLDVAHAVSEPDIRDLEIGVTGKALGRMKPEAGELKLSTHPTYTHDIPGEFIGGLKYPVPHDLMFPDTLKSVRENPKQAPQEFGSFKMVGPRQIIDPQAIDEIKQYEEFVKKYTGKKEGGAITVKPKRDGQKFKPGKKPDVLITKKPEDMVMGGNQSQISTEAFMSAGGKLSKVALEAIQRMKAMRPEIAAKSSLEQKALAENTAKYARDIQPFSMTDEEVAAEMKRLESKGMAGGGEVNADDLILEERPL
jgi:hypothetical protein